MKSHVVKLVTFSLCLLMVSSFARAQPDDTSGADVRIITDYGTMLVKLYDETPQHRDNFLKLVEKGFYDDLLFHRVIEGFMVQGGDPNSKSASAAQNLGNGGLEYLIPAEIQPDLYHKKGALAAARQPDQVNPERKSSACQFYLVQGKKSPPHILERMAARRQSSGEKDFSYSDAAKEDYATTGGAPHLDGAYTVFGEVVDGLEVIDKIAAVESEVADQWKTCE